LVSKLFWSIPGSKPPGNGRRIFFLHLPSAVVVGESSVARGTEAVKLSVKLLSGLTLMALIAVAVVGLSRSASAAADAKIYITNKASNLTTESPAPTGRTTASTVYGTYDSSTRDIVADSDTFIVTVVDSDLNNTTTVTSDETGAAGFDVGSDGDNTIGTGVTDFGGSNQAGLDTLGDIVTITLNDQSANPIVGELADISIVQTGTTTVVAGLAVHAIVGKGDGTSAPVIQVSRVGAVAYTGLIDIKYPTSGVDTTTATVKSVVDPGGTAVVTLTETGRNTGRFEGYVKVAQRDATNFTVGTAGGAVGNPADIPAVAGPITVTYTDAATAGTATNVPRVVSASLDITPPTASISGPSTGSETQNRQPVFSGNVSDGASGIDVSTFALYIDQGDDATNTTEVIATANGAIAGNAAIASVDTSGNSDGVTSMAFSHTPSTAIPTAVASNPNHIVDFQVKVADLAGNYGYSDSDSTGTAGRLGNKPHTVKIDQRIPVIASAQTGKAFDADAPTVNKTNVRDSIKVSFDGNIKASSVSPSDFKVTLSGNGGVFVPATIVVNGADVYLDLDTTIPSNNTPTVALQGTVQDLAGNSTDAGSAVAADDLSPVLTVTRSGGTGTGTGSEDSGSLTKGDMVITVSSDENLGGSPLVTVTNITANAPVVTSVAAVPQGGNTWKITVNGGAQGDRAVKVVGVDTANNSTTVGNDTAKAYTVDLGVAAPTSGPGNTTQSNPFITTDYSSDQSSLTVTSATLDGVDVTAHVVASADSKKFFFQPTTALTDASHTYVIKVTDAAGNTLSTSTTFTKSARTDFVIELFAGWNSISVPSNPIDNAIGSVFSNAGVKQVVAYDASTPAQPWRIASKVDGSFSSQTNPGLDSIHAGHGYWVETGDFENQKVALHGPTGPGDARPGLTTIPTGNGWNFVGVVDQSRIQTQASSMGVALRRPDSSGNDQPVDAEAYFNTVNVGRAYTFDTVDSEFRNVVLSGATSDSMTIGSGVWAFISPQENGKLPHIVP
jgi:hypothetical protein